MKGLTVQELMEKFQGLPEDVRRSAVVEVDALCTESDMVVTGFECHHPEHLNLFLEEKEYIMRIRKEALERRCRR